ncbi:MAG: glycosyltransferase family 2 protein [Ferroplasma sp.]
MSVSAVIPTINEAGTIEAVITGLKKQIGEIEIIVVDTNSSDNTREIATKNGAIVISQPYRGYGRAYKTGLEKATGDIIVCMDGDGTYPVELAEPLIKLLQADGIDFISCDRMTLRTPHNYTMLHFVGNNILNLTMRILFQHNLSDSQSGMWIFYKSIYLKMKNLSNGMSFSEDIKIEALKNGKFIEIPIKYGTRISKPKLKTWEDGFRNLFHLIVKRIQD